jgi:uncharacterized phage protein (TIGR02216 family)
MEIGLGVMRMRQSDFWDSSPQEFYAALRGFQEFNGANENKPLTKDELNDLMERYPD